MGAAFGLRVAAEASVQRFSVMLFLSTAFLIAEVGPTRSPSSLAAPGPRPCRARRCPAPPPPPPPPHVQSLPAAGLRRPLRELGAHGRRIPHDIRRLPRPPSPPPPQACRARPGRQPTPRAAAQVVAIVCGMWVARVSQRGGSEEMSFGWRRAEVVGAFANGARPPGRRRRRRRRRRQQQQQPLSL